LKPVGSGTFWVSGIRVRKNHSGFSSKSNLFFGRKSSSV
jgi:hypothetical protein